MITSTRIREVYYNWTTGTHIAELAKKEKGTNLHPLVLLQILLEF